MAVPKIQGAQRDFSSGEIDVTLKRSDEHPARKTGLRQMSNMRILNSGAAQNRPGRSALFPLNDVGRTEEVTMSPGNKFKLVFGRDGGNGSLRIFTSANVRVASIGFQGNGAPLPWTLANLDQIVFCQLRLSIYITFPGMLPQVVTWDGVSTWGIADFQELVIGGQKRTPFYRLSPQGVTVQPGAQSGSGVNLVASAAIWRPGHVGTRIRYCNRQVLITAVNAAGTVATISIQESLPGSQIITTGGVDPATTYGIGDEVIGSATNSVGIVVNVNSAAFQISVQLITESASPSTDPFNPGTVAFTTADTVVGPGGGIKATVVTAIGGPQAVTFWDDEVMNSFRGYPASCFVDQFRVGFCNFPALPEGIGWSAINSPTDLYPGNASSPADAIFELAPDKVQVFYVVAGAESSEFVFCDKRLYYIKIDANNPLRPGSVGFQTLSSDGCAQVQPRPTQELVLYVNAGRTSVIAILALGAFYRPFNTKNLCDYNSNLFSNIRAIASPTADASFSERYAYVMNGDGSIVIGKYTIQDGQVTGNIGWGPWSGEGQVQWVSALDSDVLFTTKYFTDTTIIEILDDNQYLDGALFVNNLPAAFVVPGFGPLYWAKSRLVSLMDQGTRSMGTYQVDANGYIVPQNNGGENLLAPTLVAGLPWTSTIEPFCPDANPGPDVQQRMRQRRVARFDAYVVHSTGFVLGRLFSGPITPTSPALGTLMNFRRFTAWNQGDDPTLPPPSREITERIRPVGRSFDPRVVLIKDTPGPLQVLELGIETTI